MRKIYVLCFAALTAGGMMAAPVSHSIVKKSKDSRKTELRKPGIRKNESRAGNAIWRPGQQILSEWNVEEEAWEETAKYVTSYDDEGRILTDDVVSLLEDEPGTTRTVYEYDEFGMPVTRLVQFSEDGINFENYTYTVRVYDPIVHSCIISNTEYLWMDGAWEERGNCYRREVTRNAEGNVTEVVIKTLYMGNYEASQKLTVEYGDDNKASRLVSYVLTLGDEGEDEFVWETEMEYRDIVWDHTNGQILSIDDTSTVENGVASCVVLDIDGENYVTVEYPDNNGSFKSHLVYDMGELDVTNIVIDNYGSYDYTQKEIYREEGEEDYTYTTVERYRKNEYGLETEIYAGEAENDDEIFVYEWIVGEIEANSEYGYPDLYTARMYDPEEDEFFNMVKISFSGYSDVTGIDSVSDDNSTKPVEYFTIQGTPVKGEPASGSGIYIRRQGDKVTKILR